MASLKVPFIVIKDPLILMILHLNTSFKYFIGYRHKGNAFPSLLCVKLPQMNAYAKYFDKIINT